MHKLFRHRRLHSLIVTLAILLNLCAPAIGHAITVLGSDALTLELCSASAASADTGNNGKRTPNDLPQHGIKHCALCALHTGSAAPPPAGAGLLTILEGHHFWPASPYAVPVRLSRWSDAQPRAPPAAA